MVNYDLVKNNDLTPAGATEAQVQVAWIKVANPGPTVSLPSPNADAYTLVMQIGNIVRALRVRYLNIRIVYLSSRIYAGYATSTLNPEPYVGIGGQVGRAGADRADAQRPHRRARRGPQLQLGRAVDGLGSIPLGRRDECS
jgi:hypothetical protein